MATESDNVNSGALGTLVAVGTIAFFGIALVVTALVRSEMGEELAKKEVSADRAYRDMLAEQTAKLAAPAAYVDQSRGVVTLPIDRAMELTVEGLKKDPNSATPVSTGGSGNAGGAAAGGAGGAAAGGAGGAGGADAGATGKPADEAVKAEPKSSEEGQPKEKAPEKKKAPAPAPKPAPAPAVPAPTPAPAPTNG